MPTPENNAQAVSPDSNNTAQQSTQQPQQQTVQEQIAEGAQQRMNEAGAAAAKTAEEAAQDVKNAATAAVSQGQQQLQQMGQEGVKQVGNAVGQLVKPQMSNQPPVNKDEKVYAAISYVPFVALVSIIIKPDSSFVRLHAKQGLLLALIFFFIGIFAAIVSLFGIIGQLLAFVLGLVPLAALIVAIYSMYLSYLGYWWKIPVLGSVADVIPVEWMAKTSKQNLTGQAGMAKQDYDVRQEAVKQENKENQPVSTASQSAAAAEPVQATAKPEEQKAESVQNGAQNAEKK